MWSQNFVTQSQTSHLSGEREKKQDGEGEI